MRRILIASLFCLFAQTAMAQNVTKLCYQVPGSPYTSCQPVTAAKPLPVTVNAAGITGKLPIANGGTNATTAATAISNLLGNPAAGTYSIICASGTSCAPTAGGGSSAFSGLTSGTNTAAAMVVGSGATLAATGSGTIVATSVPTTGLPVNATARVIGIGMDGAGSVLTTGTQTAYFTSPFSGTITGWSIAGDQSGSISVDVWKAAGAIPTIANTIVASAPPALSSSQYLKSTTLTGWATSVAVGDVFGFKINSVTSLTHAQVQLYITTN